MLTTAREEAQRLQPHVSLAAALAGDTKLLGMLVSCGMVAALMHMLDVSVMQPLAHPMFHSREHARRFPFRRVSDHASGG